jgi:hypothetical protein
MMKKMMKKLLLFVAFLIFYTSVFAQNNSIKGIVANEKNEPVAFATVALRSIKDSSIVKYASSNDYGIYELQQIVNGQYLIEASCMGYSAQSTKAGVFGNNKLEINFTLKNEIVELEASKVKANYKGVEFSGDTIRYNPIAYTDGSEVTLGDLLKKLPGINVDESGNIKAQGKDVEKVLIEGKDLFSGNTQTPLQNLPAEIAEKVEVVNNYSEYDIMKGFQSYEKTAINVKVNQNFWDRINGDLSVAGGISEKFYTKNNIIRLMPKFMTSVTLSGNNLGERLLQFDDYIKMKGGLNEFMTGENTFSFSLDETESSLVMPAAANTYSSSNNLALINISAQPNDKFKVNAYGLFNISKTRSKDERQYTYFNSGGNEHYGESQESTKRNRLGSGFLKMLYSPSKTLNYIYQGSFNDAVVKSASDIDNLSLFTFTQNMQKSLSTTHSLNAIKKINENVFISNLNFSYKNTPLEYRFDTDSLLLPFAFNRYGDNLFHVLQKRNTIQKNANIDLSYMHKLSSSYFVKIVLGANYTRNDFASRIYENHPGDSPEPVTDSRFINDSYIGCFNQSLNVNITKNQGIFGFKAGVTARNMIFNHNINRNIDDRNRIVFEPQIEVSLKPKQMRRFSISYQKSFNQISVYDLISGFYINNFSSYTGINHLENPCSDKHSVSALYTNFDQFHNITFMFSGRYEHAKNTATKDYYRTGLLNEIHTVASPYRDVISCNSTFSKKFLFAPITLDINANYQQNAYSYFTSGIETDSKNHSTSASVGLSSSYKEGFNFGANTSLSRNYYKTVMSVKQDIQRYSGKISFRKNSFYISTSLDYEHNDAREIMQRFYYWNADIRYSFANKKYELQIIGKDMLHTSDKRWQQITNTDNAIIESFMRRIPGSIILKFNMKI